MKITRNEQQLLINKINNIMSELSIVLSDCDSSATAQAIGRIMDTTVLILHQINNAKEEQHDINKEIWF